MGDWNFKRLLMKDEVHVTLCDDIVFQILLLVPTESLVKFQFVCKTWFETINSSVFINSHHQNNSETLLINYSGDSECVLYVDSGNCVSNKSSIDVDAFSAVTSLNGLVLLMTTAQRYLLVNPVTTKLIHLPHKLVNPLFFGGQNLSLAFCDKSKTYKVVHFFRRHGYGSYRCEILTIGTNRWRTIDQFPSEFKHRGDPGLFLGGSLYWTLHKHQLVVMNVHDENFSIKDMSTFNLYYDHRLMEIAGNLGVVCRTDFDEDGFQVWVSDKANEIWTKMYEIPLHATVRFSLKPACRSRDAKEIIFSRFSLKPVCCSRDAKEIIFSRFSCNHVYVYDLIRRHWTQRYKRESGNLQGMFIPHRNTLVWWE